MSTIKYYLIPANIVNQVMDNETIDELLEDNDIIEIETALDSEELKEFIETIDIDNC